MKPTRIVRKTAVTMNGISIAYLMGFANSVIAAINTFGVHMTGDQRVAVYGLLNASLVLGIHLAHRLGETQAAGGQGELSRAQVASITEEATPGA